MKERKYKEDYGFATTMDHRGKEKREAVYRGNWYSYRGEEAAGRKAFTSSLVHLLVCIGFYLLYMHLNTPSSRCMYVMPVAACALAPLAYWCMGLFSMRRNLKKMTRLEKENGVGRVLRSCVGCGVLVGLASIGDLLFVLFSLKGRWQEEIFGFAALLCFAMCAMGSFLRIRDTYHQMDEVAKGGDSQ